MGIFIPYIKLKFVKCGICKLYIYVARKTRITFKPQLPQFFTSLLVFKVSQELLKLMEIIEIIITVIIEIITGNS